MDKYMQEPNRVMESVNKSGAHPRQNKYKYSAKEIIDILENKIPQSPKIPNNTPAEYIEKQKKLEQELHDEILKDFAIKHPDAYKIMLNMLMVICTLIFILL